MVLDEAQPLRAAADRQSHPQMLLRLKTQAEGAEAADDALAAGRYHLERCTVAPADTLVSYMILLHQRQSCKPFSKELLGLRLPLHHVEPVCAPHATT